MDVDSISAKVFGDGQIFSVQFKEIYLKEPLQEKIQVLEQKIKGHVTGREEKWEVIRKNG
ncbi:MAG: hypothetical protein JRJ77_14065 [Deltaproteobacteria bacterium]|nr:hypothetical protein [Deltaproteobacteria bacterium]